MDQQEKMNPFQELLARALAAADADMLRAVVAKTIEHQLADYRCQEIVSAAVEPVVRQLAKELVKDETVFQQLRARVQAELLRVASNFTLTLPLDRR